MPEVSDLDRRQMDELTVGLRTKSGKIRRLSAAGYQCAEIARYLGIRYQFAYNVLNAPPTQTKQSPRDPTPQAAGRVTTASRQDPPEPSVPSPNWIWTMVGKGGVIRLPAAVLTSMAVAEGDQVQLALDGDVVRVLSRAAAIREAQELVRRYVPEGVSLVDELLAERRAEAAREEGR
jgi:antitoxin component of MazEF toxin-antitoxin module